MPHTETDALVRIRALRRDRYRCQHIAHGQRCGLPTAIVVDDLTLCSAHADAVTTPCQ